MKTLSVKIAAPVVIAVSLVAGIAMSRTTHDVAIRPAAERAAPAPECKTASVSPCNCVFWSYPWCAA